MPHFKKKPVVIEAHQWFKNGDHPDDFSTPITQEDGPPITPDEQRADNWEGEVVRRYRHPHMRDQDCCSHCSREMFHHGWIDTKEGGHIVCPGDWIITGVQGEHDPYPCKPDIFAETYEPATPTT